MALRSAGRAYQFAGPQYRDLEFPQCTFGQDTVVESEVQYENGGKGLKI